MRKYLLPQKRFYKANLHCHTICSDGTLTSEQIKEEYQKEGYSIVAFTDHEFIVDRSYLSDDNFLALNGYEYSVTRPGFKTFDDAVCYHINFIAVRPDIKKQIGWNPRNIWFDHKGYADNVEYTGDIYTKEYSLKEVNRLIETALKNGFIAAYNHPRWSLHLPEDYLGLKGLFGMEVYNTGCGVCSGDSYADYENMCERGVELAPLACDDNHNRGGIEGLRTPCSDSFGGYTMIAAESLSYEEVISSLISGGLYASTGAELKGLYIEDGMVHTECSAVSSVAFYFGGRRWHTVCSDKDDILKASCKIPDDAKYIRVALSTTDGKRAFSKAYFKF